MPPSVRENFIVCSFHLWWLPLPIYGFPWMDIASDKNYSDARWQAQGSKLLEPTIVKVLREGKPIAKGWDKVALPPLGERS